MRSGLPKPTEDPDKASLLPLRRMQFSDTKLSEKFDLPQLEFPAGRYRRARVQLRQRATSELEVGISGVARRFAASTGQRTRRACAQRAFASSESKAHRANANWILPCSTCFRFLGHETCWPIRSRAKTITGGAKADFNDGNPKTNRWIRLEENNLTASFWRLS
jgi:hypothetical protein